VRHQSQPYYRGQPAYWSTHSYDELGRLTQLIDPKGGVTTTAYAELLTTVTNPAGQQRREERNYLGEVVRVRDHNALGNRTTGAYIDYGFTGHQHVDRLDFIHMNGRTYDPRLGRFMQADIVVQSPSDTQSYNRYSYLSNNPLNGTDPTGYFGMKDLVGVAVAAVGFWACGPQCSWQGFATIGAASGGAQTLAYGGGPHDIVTGAAWGAFSATATWGVNTFVPFGDFPVWNVLANATVSGGISVAQGGRFGHGFISAGVSAMGYGVMNSPGAFHVGDPVAKVIASAIIGGTASELSGGKFANGAMTAAFMAAASEVASEMADQASFEGTPDYAHEGTAAERQATFNSVRGGESNVTFTDRYVGALSVDGGKTTLSYAKFSDSNAYSEWEGSALPGETRSLINGLRFSNGNIVLFRSAVIPWTRTTFDLPAGFSTTKFNISGREMAYVTLGHELAHRYGVENGYGGSSHVMSNLWGVASCKEAGYCGMYQY
jgi:RHS repeat-associated protein